MKHFLIILTIFVITASSAELSTDSTNKPSFELFDGWWYNACNVVGRLISNTNFVMKDFSSIFANWSSITNRYYVETISLVPKLTSTFDQLSKQIVSSASKIIGYTPAAENFYGAHFIFVGSSYNDYKNFTIYSKLNEISESKYFNASKPTAVFFHGFQSSFFGTSGNMIKPIVEAYLSRNEYNLIFAEWNAYASNMDYVEVVNSMPYIAQIFAKLLKQIESSSYDIKKVHLVGHSLGAQMAGMIGKLFKSENILLSRITGLDPAGPLFIGSNLALRKGDAKFVDIIHTDAGTEGTTQSTGDLDFWPNEGILQPGCHTPSPIDVIDEVLCNHIIAMSYYAESVKATKPVFMSKKCLPGSIYNKLICQGPATASMGFHASSASEPGNYYLEIRSSSPYSY